MTLTREDYQEMARLIKIGSGRLEHEAKIQEERKAAVSIYSKVRAPFFGLLISENDIEISVLQSVAEFIEEGKEMSHCVFANGYYDINKRPYSLILSAKKGGKRMETIEVNLKDYSIIQCRGKHNQDSPFHNTIVNVMLSHMDEVKRINEKM